MFLRKNLSQLKILLPCRYKKFSCRIPITINRENLKKLLDPNNREEIIYITYITKKPHKCTDKNEINN